MNGLYIMYTNCYSTYIHVLIPDIAVDDVEVVEVKVKLPVWLIAPTTPPTTGAIGNTKEKINSN